MKLLQFLKTTYNSSLLHKIGQKISQAYASSVIFSLNRRGELNNVLDNSCLIGHSDTRKPISKGMILPVLHECADKLVRITCRDFALITLLFLVSPALSGLFHGNIKLFVLSLILSLVILPLLFVKESIITIFAGSMIGRFFNINKQIVPAKQEPVLFYIIGILAIIGGIFLPFPYGLLLPLLPVARLLITYLKPISFICMMMIALSLSGTSVCIVLCILLVVSHWLQRFYNTVDKKKIDYIDILFMVYIVLCIIGSIFSFAVMDSARVSFMWLILFSAVFIIIRNINSIRDLTLILSWLLVGALIAAAIGLYQYLSGQVDTTWTDTTLFENLSIRVYSTFANPNVFGEFLLLVIPFAAGLGIYFKEIKYKISCFFVLALSLIALALTYSRGCYAGIAVTAIVFLWMYNKKILGLLLVVGTPVGIMMLPQNMIDRILSMVNFADTSTSYRLKIYQGTFGLLEKYWPSGLGIGEAAFNNIYPYFGVQGIVAPHSHSLFLQLMTSFGIAGLIFFIFLMFVYHRNIISLSKKYDKKDSRTSLLIIFGSIFSGFLVQSIFDYTWYNYRVYFLFWIVVALGFATHKVLRKERDEHA